MDRTNYAQTYIEALHAAVIQRDQILEEFERLKTRRQLLEAVGRAIEPLVYPDEYRSHKTPQPSSENVEISQSGMNNPVQTTERKQGETPSEAETAVYVYDTCAEPEAELNRRIRLAVGRSVAA